MRKNRTRDPEIKSAKLVHGTTAGRHMQPASCVNNRTWGPKKGPKKRKKDRNQTPPSIFLRAFLVPFLRLGKRMRTWRGCGRLRQEAGGATIEPKLFAIWASALRSWNPGSRGHLAPSVVAAGSEPGPEQGLRRQRCQRPRLGMIYLLQRSWTLC